MIPNIKFYVISIAAIFAALGIGIFVGFLLDAQNLIMDQRHDIIIEIEKRFDYLSEENRQLKEALESTNNEKKNYEHFIDSTYKEIIKDRLVGVNIAIIETSNDYIYSSLGQLLEAAGANVVNLTTITDTILNEELLINLYKELQIPLNTNHSIAADAIIKLTESIIKGEMNELVLKLDERGFINLVGPVNEPADYIIVAGGSTENSQDRINIIDSTIINVAKSNSIPVVGVERVDVNYSYMDAYKKLGITTIDNVDTSLGKVSLILAMEGRSGHYGVKKTAEELIPSLNIQ